MSIQPLTNQHYRDSEGRTTGGYTVGTGITITWQNGPVVDPDTGDDITNGAFVETVIEAAMHRLYEYQDTSLNCPENAEALSYLMEALGALNHRTALRKSQGFEGTYQAHDS